MYLINYSANAETWSCTVKMETPEGYTEYIQEWTIAEDRMRAPRGRGFYRVILNDENSIVAFIKWGDDPLVMNYVIINRMTGAYLEINNSLYAIMEQNPILYAVSGLHFRVYPATSRGAIPTC
jgi:hypothetical protein